MKNYWKIGISYVLVALMTLCAIPVSEIPVFAASVSAQKTVTLGTAKKEFKVGTTYLVPISLKNGSNPSVDSMAKDCLGNYGYLSIEEDGSVSLKAEMRNVNFGGIIGYGSNFRVYEGTSAEGATNDAKVVTTQQTASGTKVPKEVIFTVPASMEMEDGFFMSMFIDAMQADRSAYVAIDYDHAKLVTDVTYNYQASGNGKVEQFGKYDVEVSVKVQEGKIADLLVEGKNYQGSYKDFNVTYLEKAAKAMKKNVVGLYDNDQDKIKNLDVVSGATTSSKTIRNAIMQALQIPADEEKVSTPPTSIEAGKYSIDITNKTDSVVHSLVENETASATLNVASNGKMTLSYKMVSGTIKEPLYILGMNGYYKNSDITSEKNLTMSGVKTSSKKVDGYDVITDVTIPLDSLESYYYTNVYLYVPAMENLSGEQGGITFTKGKFNIRSTISMDWDSLKKIGKQETLAPELKDGTYTIDGTMLKTDKTSTSMADGALKRPIKLVVKNGTYSLVMDFQAMKAYGLSGYLNELKYFKTGYTFDRYGAPSGTTEDATVKSYQKTSSGAILRDDYGTNYPAQVEIPLIPEALEDGYVPIQVKVALMDAFSPGSGTQTMFLHLDWNSTKAYQEVKAPATPSGAKAEKSSYEAVKVSWNKVTGATGYEVYRYNKTTKKYSKIATVSATSYINKGLTTGQSYSYKVRAYKKSGSQVAYSGYSKVVSATPALTAAKITGKNSAAKTASLTWKKINGATGYVVYRATSKSGTYKAVKTITKATTVSYKDAKLTKNKTYYYKVRAYRTVNKKKVYAPYSNIVSVKIKK